MEIGQHISQRYNQELEDIRSKVLKMGGLVELQAENAVKALLERDIQLADEVSTSDYKINKMEGEIYMAKKNFLKRNESAFSKILFMLFLLVLFSLAIPEIGTNVDSPSWWVNIVDFFTNIKEHITSYWMFYTLAGALFFTASKSSK